MLNFEFLILNLLVGGRYARANSVSLISKERPLSAKNTSDNSFVGR